MRILVGVRVGGDGCGGVGLVGDCVRLKMVIEDALEWNWK